MCAALGVLVTSWKRQDTFFDDASTCRCLGSECSASNEPPKQHARSGATGSRQEVGQPWAWRCRYGLDRIPGDLSGVSSELCTRTPTAQQAAWTGPDSRYKSTDECNGGEPRPGATGRPRVGGCAWAWQLRRGGACAPSWLPRCQSESACAAFVLPRPSHYPPAQ